MARIVRVTRVAGWPDSLDTAFQGVRRVRPDVIITSPSCGS